MTRYFADELMDGFRHLGFRSVVFDARHNTGADLCQMGKGDYAFVFGINGVFTEKDIPKKIVDALVGKGTVFVAAMVDHPCHHRRRLECLPENSIILFPDHKHVSYARQFYSGKGVFGFLSHGGCQMGMAFGKKVCEREKELVFAGSYYDVRKYEDTIARMEPATRDFMRKCIGLLREKPYLTVEQAMSVVLYGEEAVCGSGTGLPIDFSEKSNSDILLFLEEYIRTDVRGRVIKSIVEHGQTIHVYGAGWETFTCDNMQNFVWEGEAEFCALSRVLDDTKLFLNVMPWFKDGSHERVFTAMLHGAVVLSDESGYLEENFQDGEEIHFYSLDRLKLLGAQIKKILKEEEKLESIRKKAFEKTVAAHLWEHRAREILSLAQKTNETGGKRGELL